ncbi:four-carbon acid sugar kinase family protein [Pseudomonas syringae]|uniref:Four-carbon acid sugar kinase family protein n=2 Tax=Pseudomonas syringae TaxID=317 RepID=A0A3M3M0H4_PSESX|nr:four-carbon acid sugar kinase family protein [Pseudomonas syringae]KWS35243.1 type III effector [Pseudomonas syringae pv. papulans]MDH4602718.1 four-carbon acid sugar kinase family protein [Pseudomonas syringae pv. papulans]MDH4622201.1 four-carbon acid sugar kinase family protein [Pseudomonas syringae pv. papulans]RMN41066.1 Type III effector Hrp-dependent outer protein [Pseudomonas syringae pv. papulans]RMN74630.1 Type III effector Hrp-dependent outer protein [Pseudomonas syringae pv. pap
MSHVEFPGLLIIADDLSRAADCAADFASRVDTHVLLSNGAPDLQGVIAFDTDSRRLAPQQAAEQNRVALQQQSRAGMALYKKIDSTLRGNIASEVDALQGLRGMALVAPAFPAMQRTTVMGVQLINGVPVDQSDVWRNEHLQGTGDLLELFAAQGLHTQWLGLDAIRDPAGLKTALRSALEQGVQVLVCDAELDSDLLRLADASVGWHDELFWVGSAGLARHLPQAFGLAAALPISVRPRSPVLTVIGSMSRHSQAQADRLAHASQALCLTLQPSTLLNEERCIERAALSEQLQQHLAAGQDVLVRVDQQQRDPARAATLSHALAQWLAPALPHAGSLIATGGETARAILIAAGIERLMLSGELATGVVLAEAQLGRHTLNVVTKAGAFGDPDTLLDAWQRLHAPAATDTPFNEETSYV